MNGCGDRLADRQAGLVIQPRVRLNRKLDGVSAPSGLRRSLGSWLAQEVCDG